MVSSRATAAPVHTRALVLRRVDYSESSQIITVDTRERGIVDLLAKGSRRAARRSSSFAEPLDLGGWYDLVYRPRQGELHLATEARLIEGFPHLRTDLGAWLETSFALEVLRLSFTPGDPHPELLRRTLSFLKLLAVGRGRLALRIRFVLDLLAISGVATAWDRCATCSRPLEGEDAFWHLPAALVCTSCRGQGDRPLPAAQRVELIRLGEIPWGNLPSEEGRAALAHLWDRLRDALLAHLERAPRSLRYLRT